MITPDNIKAHELVGMHATILGASNKTVIGLNGRVINETKSMITLNTAKGAKQIPKQATRFAFCVEGKQIQVDGDDIHKRPFERI